VTFRQLAMGLVVAVVLASAASHWAFRGGIVIR